jgi:hypothetical protein
MPPRKPRDTAPIVPTAPTSPTATRTPARSPSNALSALPESLEVQFPDFRSQIATDWFRPSSSSVPRTTAEEFKNESEIASEQNNSLQLQSMNLDNALLTVSNAVKATKIGKAIAEYAVGLEAIRGVGVRLRNEQAVTANYEKQVLITQEKGLQLDQKLIGEQTRTQIESAKNQITQLELGYHRDLKPIKEQEWKNRLVEAQAKAALTLEGMKSYLANK